jgi:3-dehydroquinate synthase
MNGEPLQLKVELGARSYPIWIAAGLLDDAARWREAIHGRHVLVVSDENVAPLYASRVSAALPENFRS